MMRRSGWLMWVVPMLMVAKVHYAKVEPITQVTVKSRVSGIIVQANPKAEGSVLGEEAFVQIDDTLDRKNLENTKASLTLIEQTLLVNQEILGGLKEMLKRKEGFYLRMNHLETASQTQKDNAYAAWIAAKNQYLGIREKIITLKKQVLDLQYKIAMLKDLIAKKHITMPGAYLYKLMVRSGEFAAPGLPLAITQDITRAQLTLYLDRDEIVDGEGKQIETKTIYIDDQPTQLKIDRLWKVADSQYISSYRARIILLPKYPFSKLLKVEFK